MQHIHNGVMLRCTQINCVPKSIVGTIKSGLPKLKLVWIIIKNFKRLWQLFKSCLHGYSVSIETPTNTNVIIEEPLEYNGEDSNGEGKEDEEEDHGDLYSGAKEMEAYQESMAIKKSIQYNLGRRSGPRWSLPHQYIG